MSLIHILEQEKKKQGGKKLNCSDEKDLQRAEKMLISELAVLFLKQVGGKDKSASLTKAEWTRMGVVLVLTAAYIFAAYMFKFMIPTIVYAFALVFFLNWKARKSWQIVFFAILVIALGLYGMPLLINLKIPML